MKQSQSPSIVDIKRHAMRAQAMLKQLANAKRLLILCQLVEGEKSVGDLSKIAALSQSALSQHLAKMRQSKLVETEKRGQMVYYRLASMEARAILSTLYLIYCKPDSRR
jgi:ArsR family transcriptional regulator